jgi:integrase/recombinase XerD
MNYIASDSIVQRLYNGVVRDHQKWSRMEVLMLSVYARHSSDCPRAGDGNWKRCRCPKWIWGTLPNGDFIRRSAKTRTWEQAEELRRELEAEVAPSYSILPSALPSPAVEPPPIAAATVLPLQKPRITIEYAVEKYLADAMSRDLEASTISKLGTIFRKQFLVWALFYFCGRRCPGRRLHLPR